MEKTNYHIVIACSYLHVPGGYEKAVITTANLFADKGHRVSLLVLDYTDETYYPVHKNVTIVHLPASFGITDRGTSLDRKIQTWKDIRKLNKVLRELRPEFFISTEYHFTAGAILGGAKNICRVFSWEHHHFYWLKKNRFWSLLSRYAYKKVDKVICLNRQEQEIYQSFGLTTVIPNFIDQKVTKGANPESKTILSVAGLIHRKGIDMMLDAAAVILQRHPDWKWKLIGAGEMKENVTRFIQEKSLQCRFILQEPAGPVIDDEYRNAALYVMTSRFEAFPMVLLEAMSWGVPCISFDCPSGPAEIITNNVTGIVVPKEDVVALTDAISNMIQDPAKRKQMTSESLEKVHQYYPDNVYQLWKKLFDEY